MHLHLRLFASSAITALTLSGCIANAEDSSDPSNEEVVSDASALTLKPGKNGDACYLSEYNCKLRVEGGNRVEDANGSIDWAIQPGANVRDGNGDVLVPQTSSSLKINFGQERVFAGENFVFALTTSNGSAGWYPLASIVNHDALAARLGHASAHGAGLEKMACYAVRNSSDPTLAEKKVVFDTEASPGPSGEAAGDYLPKLRANGQRSVNLIFNVPGSGLGGPAVDHFPAGTKFQRLDVPTDSNAPSIDVKLWLQDSAGRFRTPAGEMKFVYGIIQSKTGTIRVGWMAYDAITPSSGCP